MNFSWSFHGAKVAPLIGSIALGANLAGAAALRVSPQGPVEGADGLTWETAFPTLQEAAAAATSGDQLWIAEGVYAWTPGSVVDVPAGVDVLGGFAGTETSPEERSGGAVVLDGLGLVLNGAATIERLTIRNAQNTSTREIPSENQGGAIRSYQPGPVQLVDCRFEDNMAGLEGGAGYFSGTSLFISNCVFAGNMTVSILGPGSGGALKIVGGELTMVSSVIENNVSPISSGIDVASANVAIESSRFIAGANQSQAFVGFEITGSLVTTRFSGFSSAWGASAVGLSGSNRFDVASCLFHGGTERPASGPVSVVEIRGSGEVRFVNNTVVSNALPALSVSHAGVVIANNILAGNAIGVTSEVELPDFHHNNVHGNATNYAGIADPTGTQGNISADPLFAGAIAEGDPSLDANSPSRDAGSATFVIHDKDIDGAPRVQGAAPDMGASEFAGGEPGLTLTFLRASSEISWPSSAGTTYSVWQSEDLEEWDLLQTVEATNSTTLVPIASTGQARFFRISEP